MDNLIGMTIAFTLVGAWLTHVVTCLADGLWGFLIAGALLFPIGMIHGIGIWFGAW
jgi:sorbitol-specific phosphotransferase system component IIBC